METNYLVIGGGSAGLHLASKKKSLVIEEHEKVGIPVACTGLVTDEILKFYDEKEIKKITNKEIERTKIFTPNRILDTQLKKDYVLCNQSLIELTKKHAEENNSEILLKHHYLGNSHNKARILDRDTNKTKIIKFKKLIGADGPHSKVAKNNNLASKRKHVIGVQVVREHKMDDSIHFFPHVGEYAWAVPESETKIRLGLCTRNNNAMGQFQEFQKMYPGKDIANISGTIPLYHPGQIIARGKTSVIGDAACQTKNTTGGGIIAGFKAAEAVASGNYGKNIKALHRELFLHYLANKAFQKYANADWDKLANKFQEEKMKKLLGNTSRDNLVKLGIKAIIQKPSLAGNVIPFLK